MRYGMTVPLSNVPLSEQVETAKELADAGYTDVWSSEAMGADCFVPLAVAAVAAPTLRLGTAIAPAYTRGPACLAQSAATLGATAPGRFVVGVGSSSQVIVEDWNDRSFERPFHRTRDVVRFLRQAFAGERIDADFDTFRIRGFRLGVKVDPAPPILVAALRSRMLRMAGVEADGAIINWLSASDVGKVAPLVHAGGPGKEIVARIMVMPTSDTDAARAVARRLIATYLNVPVYAEFHRWLGRADQLQQMWELWATGSRSEAAASVPDSVVDALVLHGPPEACQEQIQAYVDNGVTTPVLSLIPTQEDPRKVARQLAPR